jgi:hypothetical protein
MKSKKSFLKTKQENKTMSNDDLELKSKPLNNNETMNTSKEGSDLEEDLEEDLEDENEIDSSLNDKKPSSMEEYKFPYKQTQFDKLKNWKFPKKTSN